MTAAPSLVARGRSYEVTEPLLMGIVNASPDSFSDGGVHPTTASRVKLALDLAEQGAAILDVGGQSSVTGVPEIAVGDEIARVVPVIEGIRTELPEVGISVDTYRPAVVDAVLAAGASIVNDVSGLRHPEVADLCAAAGAGLVVMHTRAPPKHKVLDPDLYDDVTADVVDFLATRVDEAVARGVPREAIIVDPGPDFAKTPAQTIEVLRGIDRVRALGRPVLLALSRKDFIGAITGRPPRRRLAGTLAAVGHLLGEPGHILRVHDVAAVADYLAVAAVLAGRAELARDTVLAAELRHEPLPRSGVPQQGCEG